MMQDRRRPTQAQSEYAEWLLIEAGYDDCDVRDMCGKDFEDLTRSEMARLIDDLKHELEG